MAEDAEKMLKKAQRALKQNSTSIERAVKDRERELKAEKEITKEKTKQTAEAEKISKAAEKQQKALEAEIAKQTELNNLKKEAASKYGIKSSQLDKKNPYENEARKIAAQNKADEKKKFDESRIGKLSSFGKNSGEGMRAWAQARPSVRAGLMGGGAVKALGGGVGLASLATGGIAAGIEAIKKAVEVLAASSPSFAAGLKLINKSLMLFLRPIGDLLGAFLRPIARMMLAANRKARQAARETGARPGSAQYTQAYYSTLYTEMYKGITDGLKQLLDGYGLGWIVDLLITVRDVIFQVFGWIWDGLMILYNAFMWLYNLFAPVREVVMSVVGPFLSSIYTVLCTTWDILVKHLGMIYNFLAGFVGAGINAIVTAVGGVKWFLEQVYNVLKWVGDLVSNFIGGVGDFMSDPVGNAAKAVGVNGRVLPWFANGGTITGGKAVIGVGDNPAGIEHIVPEEKKFDFAQRVLGGASSSTSVHNHFNMNAPVFGVNDLERKMRKIVNDAALDSRRR